MVTGISRDNEFENCSFSLSFSLAKQRLYKIDNVNQVMMSIRFFKNAKVTVKFDMKNVVSA